MSQAMLEIALRNLHAEYVRTGMSYAEYVLRYDRFRGVVHTFESFRINGGSRADYESLVVR